jgi:sugar lactone lactonase YvrE
MAAPLSAGSAFPEKILLPPGFRPEGITIGKQATFYVGSVGNGAIYRGSLRTGAGGVLVPGGQGRLATGMKLDRRGRLFVSGASTGQGYVYDAGNGALLATYQLALPPVAPATPSFINDVIVTRNAAYFTDSLRPFIYKVSIGQNGALGATVDRIPLTGDLVYSAGFNVNGIEKAQGGKTLLLVQSNKGLLFTANPTTGVTRQINLGASAASCSPNPDIPNRVCNGDGILRDGRTLFVVQNSLNRIAVVQLGRNLASGTITSYVTDRDFDVPTTVDDQGKRLFAVNARFSTPPTPTTEYWVAQAAKPARADDDDNGDDGDDD